MADNSKPDLLMVNDPKVLNSIGPNICSSFVNKLLEKPEPMVIAIASVKQKVRPIYRLAVVFVHRPA